MVTPLIFLHCKKRNSHQLFARRVGLNLATGSVGSCVLCDGMLWTGKVCTEIAVVTGNSQATHFLFFDVLRGSG